MCKCHKFGAIGIQYPDMSGARYTDGTVLKGRAAARVQQRIRQAALAGFSNQTLADTCMVWTEGDVAKIDPNNSSQIAALVVAIDKAGNKDEVHFTDPSGGEGTMRTDLARQNVIDMCTIVAGEYIDQHPDAALTFPLR